MEILDRKPGTFQSGINAIAASKGRSQWLFTAGLDFSGVFPCELGSTFVLFLKSSQGVWDAEKMGRMIKLKVKL